MPAYYTYLISSLPSLQFGMKPPFSFGEFLAYCQRFIPESEIEILKKTSLKKWQDFDTALRNELVKIRAARKHLDPSPYLRQDGLADLSISHLALNACRIPHLLEAEKTLDQARWQALEEFSLGHYFDLDFLIIYALKLLILERWERINRADRSRILLETLEKSERG